MKAISVHPYYALEILTENKMVECRTWSTSHRGKLLICSTAQKEKGLIPGHALAVVDLVDVVPFEEKHLEPACMVEMPDRPAFAWIFGEAWAVEPFKVKGQQRLFTVPDSKIKIVPEDITEDHAAALYDGIIVQ